MTKRIIIVFLIFLSLSIYSQDVKYLQEEYRALDDVFLEIVDTSSYNISIIVTAPSYETVKNLSDTILFSGTKYYLLPISYEPFNMVSEIIATGGDSLKIVELFDKFNSFKDSVNGLPETRELVIFHYDSLYALDKVELEYTEDIQKYLGEKKSKVCYDTLETRYFNLNDLKNTGKYKFSSEAYLDEYEQYDTKEVKELYQLSCSRIVFNSDFTRGAIFCVFYSGWNSGYENLYFIKKKKGKWTVRKGMWLWMS